MGRCNFTDARNDGQLRKAEPRGQILINVLHSYRHNPRRCPVQFSQPTSRVPFYLSVLIFVASAAAVLMKPALADPPETEFYEIRILKIYDFEKQEIADRYLRDALLPALNRQKIENVGVFHNHKDHNDHSIYMVIPYRSLEIFSSCDDKLAKDAEYQAAATEYMQRKKGDGIYDRIESRLLKAFSGMPKMELPDHSTTENERVFELRLYESLTEEQGRLKIEMFDKGETQLMREAQLGPVFFGKVLAGPDLPCLAYLLSAQDIKSHEAHWETFLQSDAWKKMKNLPQYQGTVSGIKNWFLAPTSYSQF